MLKRDAFTIVPETVPAAKSNGVSYRLIDSRYYTSASLRRGPRMKTLSHLSQVMVGPSHLEEICRKQSEKMVQGFAVKNFKDLSASKRIKRPLKVML